MRSLRKALRYWLPSIFFLRRPDLAALLALLALTLVGQWDLLRTETTLGSDAATQYYPFYYFLGESLRSGEIPAWNPYQFSGTPFAADPLSGWSYLPAMALFAFLPLAGAVKGLMFSHLLLAGLFSYALARALGIEIPGAFLAAIAYEYNGLFYIENTCCLQYTGVMTWLPLTLLSAELAIRSPRWPIRVLWWGVSGLALSQILAAWFVQGSYYALLVLGGYIAYRTLLFPPENMRGIRGRAGGLSLHGGAVLLFGFCLAAAGVLPRLEYNALSNLAGGYPAGVRAWGGWSVRDWVLLLEPGFWYAGVTILALALVAPLVARKRFAVPYFSALALGALILTGQGPTPLHSVLYLLPYFERLHPHDPDRVILIFYLGAALLAGGTLTVLGERAGRKPSLLALPVLAVLLLATVSILFPPESGGWVTLYPLPLKNGISVPVGSLLFLVLIVVLIAAYALLPTRLRAWRGITLALLILVVFADLLAADKATIAKQNFSGPGWLVRIREMDLAEYYNPSGAARFLQSKEGEEEPFRYFGYDPGSSGEGSQVSAPMWFADPGTQALEANGRSMLLGLQNVQGYNPTHSARYDRYVSALNGDEQNYHFLDVYQKGLDSPLLDLLNARYIIVPAQPSEEDPQVLRSFERFEQTHPVVYEDDQTRVLENAEALPRAWIVHSARRVGSGAEALELLSSKEVDPKETALLEEEPPQQQMWRPEEASSEQVSVSEYEANRIKLKSSAQAPGLLMLSEVYYPAWKAYVDGRPAPVYVADQLLRSVPVPEGEHEVELRYESVTLGAGVAVSLAAYAALAGLTVVAGTQRWRERSI